MQAVRFKCLHSKEEIEQLRDQKPLKRLIWFFVIVVSLLWLIYFVADFRTDRDQELYCYLITGITILDSFITVMLLSISISHAKAMDTIEDKEFGREDEIDRQQWSELVRNSETGTWFQSPEAYAFFASMPALMEPFAFGIERDGKLCAVCVGYITKERNPIKQFFTRRAIINGGPVIAPDCAKRDVLELLNYLRAQIQLKTIYIETRNFNDYSPWKEAFEAAGFAYKPHLNFHVDPSSSHLSENRFRQVRKAQATVECITNERVNEAKIEEWYKVLAKLYRTKVKTPLWPMEFFMKAYQQSIAKFLLVQHADRIIGGSMVVADERTVYEWYECGLNTDYKDQYPSVMATYAGIRWTEESGRTRYDMMGAGEPGVPYGVRDFKAEFGGTPVEHGRFLCICQPTLYRFGALVVKFIKRF